MELGNYAQKFHISKPANPFYEATKEIANFLGRKHGEIMKKCKGRSASEIMGMLSEAKQFTPNPKALLFNLMKK